MILKRSLILLLMLQPLSFGDFGCECGGFQNTLEEAETCADQAQAKEFDYSQSFQEDIGLKTRIVGGEDVNKECMKRPFLALLRLGNAGSPSWCMGSIINKKYVVSAAHCFCAPQIGECIENNGVKLMSSSRSGTPQYAEGTITSAADSRTAKSVLIFMPVCEVCLQATTRRRSSSWRCHQTKRGSGPSEE